MQIITVDKEIPVEVPVEVIQYVDRVVEVPVEVEKVVEIEKVVWNDRIEYRDKIVYQDRVGKQELFRTSFDLGTKFCACNRSGNSIRASRERERGNSYALHFFLFHYILKFIYSHFILQVRPVDRYIEVPVDKVVERVIEVPKPVDRSGCVSE